MSATHLSAKSFFHAKDMTAKSSLDRGDNLTLTAATIQAWRVVPPISEGQPDLITAK